MTILLAILGIAAVLTAGVTLLTYLDKREHARIRDLDRIDL